MPELPEVETVRRLLEPDVLGRTVARVQVHHAHVTDGLPPGRFAAVLRGRTVTRLHRKGKYLVFDLAAPAGAPSRAAGGGPGHARGAASPLPLVHLVAHLRMTGRLSYVPPGSRWTLAARHTHAVLHLERGGARAGRLVFYDVRKFGRLTLSPPAELAARLPSGRDPVLEGLDAGALRAALGGRRATLKALLLRQDLLCGLGNIYADEALHRAGLYPGDGPGVLAARDWSALAAAVRQVLAEALAFQGTTLWDYRRPDGQPGAFGRFLRVYGRAGLPCRACGAAVATVRLGGRSAAFCPRCQPPRAPL